MTEARLIQLQQGTRRPIPDAWQHLDEVPESAHSDLVTLPWSLWQAAPNSAHGVRLTTSDAVSSVAPAVLPAIIILQTLHFEDGRFFSQARDLRQNWNYLGPIHLHGDFPIDQLGFINRVGIDAVRFEIPPDPEQLQLALGQFTFRYQPDASYGFDIRAARRNRVSGSSL